MTETFAAILKGLMDNRGLSPRAVSRASARAESTILQLLHGSILPSPEIVKDIAPVLQIPEADLLIIADITTTTPASPARPSTNYRNSAGIGELVSIASLLSDGHFRRLLDLARSLNSEDRN
ncbi:helix-turn-helix transcriptional regulator [Streptomyces sp. NPDC001185]|uniref:helix-turn-helix transcriptional regulator n=1 Tax=Streptomyces sp. NPDC001185 TaxID=3154380 RepID=UPI00331D8AE9